MVAAHSRPTFPAFMDFPDFETLIDQSTAYLRACNRKADRFFGIRHYALYAYNLRRNEIWWSSVSEPKVRARLTVAGTMDSNTWQWAWANPRFAPLNLGAIEEVRYFGETLGILNLTEPEWPANDVDGWDMAAVSARLLETQGAYRVRSRESGGVFFLYDGLEFIPEEEKPRYRLKKHEGK
jgi:hypothetical protein